LIKKIKSEQEKEKSMKVGFIGMGIMGSPMAVNLINAGHEVYVYTRTRVKADRAIAAGAHWCDSPADTARNVDVLITCVTDTPDVRAVLLGENGVIGTGRQGLICIDMSTISPAATVEIGKILAEKGIRFIDAPVSGGQKGAEESKLSIMVGGGKADIDAVMPLFEAMGRQITHCGPLGSGQKTKLVNQVMVIHTIMSISEGFALAEKAGLDLKTTYDATSRGAAGSHSLTNLGVKIIEGDMKPAFMVDLQVKDLKLVLEYADQLKQPLPGVGLVMQLMTSLQARGRGRDGTQALVDVIRQLGT
jgi:3-hydroxyisobutyrate dehydrogenase